MLGLNASTLQVHGEAEDKAGGSIIFPVRREGNKL